MTFENQTVYLPCAMQSVSTFQQPSGQQPDQLTLILWYYDDASSHRSNCLKNCSLNTNEPPIYSIDFRAPDDARSRTTASQPSAIHFISNGRFKNRILFEFNFCHPSGFWAPLNSLAGRTVPGTYLPSHPLPNQFTYHQTNGSFRLPLIKPICAFLKLSQVRQSDAGRYSCRLDFRRSRTLHTSLLLKVLGRCALWMLLECWKCLKIIWTIIQKWRAINKPINATLLFRSTETLRNSTQR